MNTNNIKVNPVSEFPLNSTSIFSKILYKIKVSNKKDNQFLLGIDILKDSVKKDLLSISVLQVERTYLKICQSPDAISLLQKRSHKIFFECLQQTCEDFLTKKYGYKVKIKECDFKNALYTKNLLEDTEILFKVTLSSLLDPRSAIFRAVYYPIYSSASENFLEALVDNLILEISNCIVYFSLVSFSSIYAFRQILYRSKFLSLRNLERFKNNFNWQLYTRSYIQRPTDLYNNRYEIYILKTTGIYCRVIYANRSKEITSLSNVPLLTIVFIEIKDFVISRLEETLVAISKGLRFTLTSVIGQVIGLVWRGIIEGLKK